MLIRKDEHGLYIRSRGYLVDKTLPSYRPGNFPGYSHVWDTGPGGLWAGANPKTMHVKGAPFIKIRLRNGHIVYWGSHGREEGDY